MPDAEKGARCPKPWCTFAMPHEHTVGTASAGPPSPDPNTVTFTTLLNDPTQQLDTEGVVLASVLAEQERDRLRSEGWRACVEHLQQRYNRVADSRPAYVLYVMLDGEDLWFLANRLNPFRPRPLPPGDGRAARTPEDRA